MLVSADQSCFFLVSHGTRPMLWVLPRSSRCCAMPFQVCCLSSFAQDTRIHRQRTSEHGQSIPCHRETFLGHGQVPFFAWIDLPDFHLERIARRACDLDPGISISYSLDFTIRRTPSAGTGLITWTITVVGLPIVVYNTLST